MYVKPRKMILGLTGRAPADVRPVIYLIHTLFNQPGVLQHDCQKRNGEDGKQRSHKSTLCHGFGFNAVL